MNSQINIHQRNQLIDFIISDYQTFAPTNKNGKVVFEKILNASDYYPTTTQTIIPFKKILWPSERNFENPPAAKIAFLGLANCDIWALWRFYDQFKDTDLLVPKENLLVIGRNCKADKNCFCDLVGASDPAPCDLIFQNNNDESAVFSFSKAGTNLLKNCGMMESKKKIKLAVIDKSEDSFDAPKLSEIIENFDHYKDFWQGISNNCFGCGACTAVCPLCFCTKQDFSQNIDGNAKQCLQWDTCFGKRFSEIQNHYDLRPENVNRLYNWYHHKFVRSWHDNKYFLCTGCGRCIEACPSNLNIKNILKSIIADDKD